MTTSHYENIRFNRDGEANAMTNGMINISKYKNETILIKLKITCNGDKALNRFFFFIFFSDYKNIFVLNPENNTLTLESKIPKYFYIFINPTKNIKEIYLRCKGHIPTKYYNNYFYYYNTTVIEEIEQNIPDSFFRLFLLMEIIHTLLSILVIQMIMKLK